MSLEEINREITAKRTRLWRILNPEKVKEYSKKRKNYKRQPWSERADNPKRRNVYDFKKWCTFCGEWRDRKSVRCPDCGNKLRTKPQKARSRKLLVESAVRY